MFVSSRCAHCAFRARERLQRFARSRCVALQSFIRNYAMNKKGQNEMSKNNTKTRAFPIVLKTIIDDAMREKTIIDDNAKKIRAKLRVAFASQHIKNTSWIANNSREYDAIRCAFDARYAQRIENAKKRTTKKNDTKTTNETNAE